MGNSKFQGKKICSQQHSDNVQKLNNKFLTAYLVTDAPLQLLHDTQKLWLNQIQQCKSKTCFQQQFDLRFDDLNFYTSLNQTLTQHYLKFENGRLSELPVHLKIHQLDKDKLKIEGIAYRNPNNRIETQTMSLLAYSTPEKKNQIIDKNKTSDFEYVRKLEHFHNNYLEILTQYGLIGFILFLLIIIEIFKIKVKFT